MVGHPKSNTSKIWAVQATKDGLYAQAIALYQHEQQREENGQKRMSLQKVCQRIEDEHWADARRTITLDCNTL